MGRILQRESFFGALCGSEAVQPLAPTEAKISVPHFTKYPPHRKILAKRKIALFYLTLKLSRYSSDNFKGRLLFAKRKFCGQEGFIPYLISADNFAPKDFCFIRVTGFIRRRSASAYVD